MIKFKKKVKEVLPYDRRQYINFFNDRSDTSLVWYGVSFQLPGVSEGKDIGLTTFIKVYESLFKNIILKLDNGSFWVVNHDYKDQQWFPVGGNNLPHLRALFKQNNIPDTFKGALLFTKEELLECYQDLISYPYAVLEKDGWLYKNLDISHSERRFIIKISGHLNVDFLSTDKELLKEIVNENPSDVFIVKTYRGTSL